MTRARTARAGTAIAALVLCLAACGGEESPTGLQGTAGNSGTGGSDDGTGGATQGTGAGGTGTGASASGGSGPSGEFGADVGDTMANLEWVGYVNESASGLANQQSIVDYSVDELAANGAPYALVHFGAVF